MVVRAAEAKTAVPKAKAPIETTLETTRKSACRPRHPPHREKYVEGVIGL